MFIVMNIFKAHGLLAVILLSASIVGCGVQEKAGNNSGDTATEVVSPTPEPTPALKERESIIYLTDSELNETVEHPVKLMYDTDDNLVKAAINELQKDVNENVISLWKPIEVKSVKLTDTLVTLDIHLPDEARLGAPGEMFVLDNLQNTLFQFDFVQSIQLLVDGEQIETLMGHVELEHPMNKQ